MELSMSDELKATIFMIGYVALWVLVNLEVAGR